MNAQAKIREAGFKAPQAILSADGQTIGFTADGGGLFKGFDTTGQPVTDPYMNRGMASRQAKRKLTK